MLQAAKKPGQWFDDRHVLRDAFLAQCGLSGRVLSPISADSAQRRYFRIRDKRGTKLLMETVPDGNVDPKPTPGHSLGDYLRIGHYLRSISVRTPQVYSSDEKNGYLLLEDFGKVSYKMALERNLVDGETLYSSATDTLIRMRRNARREDIALPDYYTSHVHKGMSRVIEWYGPAVLGRLVSDDMLQEYLEIWARIERELPQVPMGFLHIDYHFENMMVVFPDCGVLDFQGAMWGPLPYDLANLVEDARVDVPLDLRYRMIDRYCADMDPEEEESFRAWYRVLATQFHCRVIGQFIKLAVDADKPRYLEMIPRVARYLREGLKDPLLKDLRQFFTENGILFDKVEGFRPEQIQAHIKPGAF